jgi:DNA-binding IclR family transcriptional regulator
MQSTKSVPAVERSLIMLEALDRSVRGMNIAELARKLGIARSTAHSIVLTLERSGYLTRDASQRHCVLSAKAYLLGRETMRFEQLANAALRPMRQLTVETRLTSHMAMLEDNQATYIQKVQAPGMLNFDTYIGKRTNLHCTAVGKVLLSYAPEPYRNKVLERGSYARYTQNTITMASTLRNELKNVYSQGYAVDNQEEELNIRCFAVPVLSSRGDMLAALSISGTSEQLHENRIRPAVELLQRTAALVVNTLRHVEASDVA